MYVWYYILCTKSNYIYQLDVVDYKQKVAKYGNTQIKYTYVQIVLQCSTDVTDVAIIYLQCNIHVKSIRYFGIFKFLKTALEHLPREIQVLEL